MVEPINDRCITIAYNTVKTHGEMTDFTLVKKRNENISKPGVIAFSDINICSTIKMKLRLSAHQKHKFYQKQE